MNSSSPVFWKAQSLGKLQCLAAAAKTYGHTKHQAEEPMLSSDLQRLIFLSYPFLKEYQRTESMFV